MAAGSQIRIDKNGITITTPNRFIANAAQHVFQSGASVDVQLPILPNLNYPSQYSIQLNVYT
jgi:type VI secretion system secreted protein VgrG